MKFVRDLQGGLRRFDHITDASWAEGAEVPHYDCTVSGFERFDVSVDEMNFARAMIIPAQPGYVVYWFDRTGEKPDPVHNGRIVAWAIWDPYGPPRPISDMVGLVPDAMLEELIVGCPDGTFYHLPGDGLVDMEAVRAFIAEWQAMYRDGGKIKH